MRAVQIDEFGGPEVLKLVDIPEPEPGDGQVLIKVTRVGMNFADTHQRENTYLAPYEVPLVLGGEVAGIDPDGRRVIALLANGGYAEYAVAHESMVFPVPDGLGDGEALALLIQGLTAWHLFRTSAKLAPGEAVVVVSGAGGVGSLAVQLAAPFGAGRVIATASTHEKRELGGVARAPTLAVDPAWTISRQLWSRPTTATRWMSFWRCRVGACSTRALAPWRRSGASWRTGSPVVSRTRWRPAG